MTKPRRPRTNAQAAAAQLQDIASRTYSMSVDQSIAFAHAQATLALAEAQERANHEAHTANMIAAATLIRTIDGPGINLKADIARIDDRLGATPWPTHHTTT